MNIFYRLMRHLFAAEPSNADPLALLSLRQRADVPPWHEATPCPVDKACPDLTTRADRT